MRYWPLSVIRTSPLLPGACAMELDDLYVALKLSAYTFQACGFVASKTQPIEAHGMVIMEGDESALPKPVFVTRPTQEQWECLERACVVKGPDGPHHFIFIIDALQ